MKYSASGNLAALEAVSAAADKGSLSLFYAALQTHSAALVDDSAINVHLAILCHEITEKNIANVVKPYSHVQVEHIAAKIGLPVAQIESILSTMILDKQISGVIDQQQGVLIMRSEPAKNALLDESIETIRELQSLVSVLHERVAAKC